MKLFKYLGKVFSCSLKHVNLEELSDEVQECIESKDKDILLVQVIDNSNKYDVNLKNSSQYPM